MTYINNQFGMVFAMSNAVQNFVSTFARGHGGMLTFLAEYPTGGNGTGVHQVDPLGSQGALIVAESRDLLFVVNAGSNSISSFRLRGDGLELVDVVNSGGVMPNSLAFWKDFLYVTNVGDATHPATVIGFSVDACGRLSRLRGATHTLSIPAAQPSCVVIDCCHRQVIVSEKGGNMLATFHIEHDGKLSAPLFNLSNGAEPFGSTLRHDGVLIVSEAGANALSSYSVTNSGALHVISGSVPNGQQATCWVSLTPNERFSYTSNAGSGTLTRYQVHDNGSLARLDSVKSIPSGTAAPIDSAIDSLGKNLYVLNGNLGSISVFKIAIGGTLVFMQEYTNTRLPQVGAQGIAVI